MSCLRRVEQDGAGTAKQGYSIIARFDCDLSLDLHDPMLKNTRVWHRPEVYFEQGLSKEQKARILKANQELVEGGK